MLFIFTIFPICTIRTSPMAPNFPLSLLSTPPWRLPQRPPRTRVTLPYHTTYYHTKPYHITSYHTIPYHTTSYHTNSYQVIPYHLQLPPLHTSFATSPNVISRRSLLHFKLRVDLANASFSKYSQSKLSQKVWQSHLS